MKTEKIDETAGQNTGQAIKTNNTNSSKVYFFIIAIFALLATNVYFFVKFRTSGEKLYSVTLERESLQADIDRIEAELDNVKNQGIDYSPAFANTENRVRFAIENLRSQLETGDLSEEILARARFQVSGLKDDVAAFREETVALRIKAEMLEEENSRLDDELQDSKEEIAVLERRQDVLNQKISRASSIKTSKIHLNGVEVKRNGSLDVNMRARRVDKLKINFTLADNPVAELGNKEVFVRVINPNGSLLANPEDLFFVHGEKLQYTFKENIWFTNNGEEYQFLWADENGFKKGAYTILLYADNAIMGRSSIVFK